MAAPRGTLAACGAGCGEGGTRPAPQSRGDDLCPDRGRAQVQGQEECSDVEPGEYPHQWRHALRHLCERDPRQDPQHRRLHLQGVPPPGSTRPPPPVASTSTRRGATTSRCPLAAPRSSSWQSTLAFGFQCRPRPCPCPGAQTRPHWPRTWPQTSAPSSRCTGPSGTRSLGKRRA